MNNRATMLVLPPNNTGRDLFVGDLHGELAMLLQLLDYAMFDVTMDRLIHVGDFVDRGPAVVPLLEHYLESSWFFSIAGNHDLLAEQCLSDPQSSNWDLWQANGGSWEARASAADKALAITALKTLALAIEVPVPGAGLVGVVHAEVPIGRTWSDVRKVQWSELDVAGRFDECAWPRALTWGRTRIESAEALDRDPSGKALTLERQAWHRSRCVPVPGIDVLVCGHTPLRAPRVPQQVNNVLFIDTGAYDRTGVLTIVDIGNSEYHQCNKRGSVQRENWSFSTAALPL